MNASGPTGIPASAFTCRQCGQPHEAVRLRAGDWALCTRCEAPLVKGRRWGAEGGLAFAVTGLILAVPAVSLPFLTAGKLGNDRVSLLLTGVDGLWENNMRLLAVWVFLCSAFVPIVLLVVLAAVLGPRHFATKPELSAQLSRAALALEQWAMPEVQVLAVLVALMKLGHLVNVTIGAGFWCYAGMSFALLLAWRSVDLAALAEDEPAELAAAVAEKPS